MALLGTPLFLAERPVADHMAFSARFAPPVPLLFSASSLPFGQLPIVWLLLGLGFAVGVLFETLQDRWIMTLLENEDVSPDDGMETHIILHSLVSDLFFSVCSLFAYNVTLLGAPFVLSCSSSPGWF